MPDLSTANILDLAYHRREKDFIYLQLWEDDDQTAEYDLTDCECYSHVRTDDGEELLLDLDPQFDVDPTTGIITLTVDISGENEVEAQDALWDLLFITATGRRIILISGQFHILPAITDDVVP